MNNRLSGEGTGQAFLPGGPRTGAPGKHVIRGKAKYRILDEKVRVYVAPKIEDIVKCPVRLPLDSLAIALGLSFDTQLKPYVALKVKVPHETIGQAYNYPPKGGITAQHYYDVAKETLITRESLSGGVHVNEKDVKSAMDETLRT